MNCDRLLASMKFFLQNAEFGLGFLRKQALVLQFVFARFQFSLDGL
jgi:hypothetical protein